MSQTYIIAEAGVNHNGELKTAIELVDAAVEAGADAVKFQTFNARSLVTKEAMKADYQKEGTSNDKQFEMLSKLELSHDAHRELFQYCKKKNIEFLSTPFDMGSLSFLINEFDLSRIKVPSGEITNAPFLLEIGRLGKDVILSTGVSTLGEIEQALMIIAFGLVCRDGKPTWEKIESNYYNPFTQEVLKKKLSILHCTSSYPTKFDQVNLKAMDTIRNAFGLQTGLSDHSVGISIPIAAVARGAVIIEKHFTIDKELPGPDHKASLDPIELKNMVRSIREVEQAMGGSIKGPTKDEVSNKSVIRKSLVALKPIQEGDLFTEDNITVKRPGTGISSMFYWDWLGKRATRSYNEDELIQ
jgi:N-acetylneuraminate synthase